MGRKSVFKWLSGLWSGVFIGALVACPAKEISLPVSFVLALLFGLFGR